MTRDPKTGMMLAGASGNPGGRPNGLDVFRKACQNKSPSLITKLYAIALGKSPAPAVKAAELLLAYAWGRPNQTITGGDSDDAPIRIDAPAELRRIMSGIAEKAALVKDGADGEE